MAAIRGRRTAVPTHGESLQAAFDPPDLQQHIGLLDQRIICRGPPDDAHDRDEDDARGHNRDKP
jgi:hypothetical protein